MTAKQINITAVPNQTFSVATDDGHNWYLHFYEIPGAVAADVTLDDVVLIEGVTLLPSQSIVPYGRLSGSAGIFAITTLNDALPDWNEFGKTQFLYYFLLSDLA